MENEKIFAMAFGKVFPLLIAKAERKGRSREEVLAVTAWLTGYSPDDIEALRETDTAYGVFFRQAPGMNPDRNLIKGSVCGVKLDEIEDPLMLDIRRLDKLVDELAKGKTLEKIICR